jgi:hypothetical protein
MFRATALLAILASAAAFVPMGRVATSSALKMSFSSELGAQPPLGFWDPLNILEYADEERFERLRFVENKHGRISMLAILGHLVTTAGVRLPGEVAFGLGFDQIPTGLKAFDVLPIQGTFAVFHFIGLLELGFNARKDEIEEFCAEKSGFDEETLAKKKAIELNNGRAAQMGILALMVHETLDNNPYIINSLLGFPVDFNAGF